MEILVVEDQKGMLQSIKQGLEEMNLKVDIATNGIEGKMLALKKSYNVIILDILMPELNGLELCKILRQSGSRTPILFISALDSVEDKISGLEAGGDDYMAKPFEFNEFLARIMALNRRNQSDYLTAGTNIIDDLEVNFETKSAYRKKIDLELTKKEFRLLEYFIKNEGRILTKSEIAGNVWDVDFDTGTNVVEVYVNYLRNKLDKMHDKKLIHTKFGIGYIFNPK
ncbi:MAG: response regulator transcription factor [Saprospiraceae bacterium]|jgi:two-component system copper resistance phosphate regulon response regulator CusR|nr:response regulator transcription factor [Saprospiraceae bacterium]